MKLSKSLLVFFSFWLLSGPVWAETLRIYAAASLTDVITELAQVYENQQANTTISISFAGSSTLARQIEKGAPADIFISADNDWMNYLQERELLQNDSRRELLRNELVLIAPLGQAVSVDFSHTKALADIFKGRLCTGDTASVPVGKYAQQALVFYGWWDGIQPRLVGTEDVRSALAFVERGECALGIVYKTDALMSKKIQVIASFPVGSHKPIVYPGALTRKASAGALGFWQFLQSSQAAEIFHRYGFQLTGA